MSTESDDLGRKAIQFDIHSPRFALGRVLATPGALVSSDIRF